MRCTCQSEELAKRLGHNDFKAKDGCLSRQKCRFAMKFKKVRGEDSANAVNAEQWKSIKLPNLLRLFCADDIYNVVETENLDISHRRPDTSVPCLLTVLDK
jgi:hypothetical protein